MIIDYLFLKKILTTKGSLKQHKLMNSWHQLKHIMIKIFCKYLNRAMKKKRNN